MAVLHRFRATLYQCPETAAERQEMMAAVNNRIYDLQSVLKTTEDHSVTQLTEVAQEIDIWETKVGSALYYTDVLTFLIPPPLSSYSSP